jgi:mannose-6-phosphate isomerase-like protein (cupin superfamily)
MQIVDANSLVGTSVEGVRGSLTLMPAFQEGGFGSQLVVVPPNTKAPKPGQRLFSRTFLLVLQGSATLSNGEFYQKITPGNMVLMEAGEERVFQTEREKFVCVEVRLGPAAPPAPESPKTIFDVPPPAAVAAPEPVKKSVGIYEEI